MGRRSLALRFVTSVMLILAAAGVDLVEVNPNADPPVCRLRDMEAVQKQEDERKSKAQKQARAEKGKMKKIRMSPRTDDGAILVKSGQIAKMLRKGQTVQVFVLANSHKDKLIVHDNAMPLLEQLYEQVFADCEEEGCCWYAVGSTLASKSAALQSTRHAVPITQPDLSLNMSGTATNQDIAATSTI